MVTLCCYQPNIDLTVSCIMDGVTNWHFKSTSLLCNIRCMFDPFTLLFLVPCLPFLLFIHWILGCKLQRASAGICLAKILQRVSSVSRDSIEGFLLFMFIGVVFYQSLIDE